MSVILLQIKMKLTDIFGIQVKKLGNGASFKIPRRRLRGIFHGVGVLLAPPMSAVNILSVQCSSVMSRGLNYSSTIYCVAGFQHHK